MDLNLRHYIITYQLPLEPSADKRRKQFAQNDWRMFWQSLFWKKRKKEKTPDKKLSRMQRVKLSFMDQCKRFRRWSQIGGNRKREYYRQT